MLFSDVHAVYESELLRNNSVMSTRRIKFIFITRNLEAICSISKNRS